MKQLQANYETMLKAKSLKPDSAQSLVLARLATLAAKLNQPPARKWLDRLLRAQTPTPRGLYIWGEVGRGKTLLMDLFFASIENPSKRRVHFHAFMQDVHAKRATLKSNDVIGRIADDFSSHGRLLCLDEMQISDIADAMIIGRLFEALAARGVCIVTTSNLPPDGLYKDGLNRQRFLPFIAWMNANLDVVHMGNGIDYRLGRMANHQTYLIGDNVAEMNIIWNELTDHSIGESILLEVLGRKLVIPLAAHGCARFSFAELCENPLGAPDYLALAHNFRTIFIADVPVLQASQRNETKRFILMIDTFYDVGTRLVISAAAPPEQLCPKGQHKAEFLRTISRLNEMQSASWWKATENDERTSPILS